MSRFMNAWKVWTPRPIAVVPSSGCVVTSAVPQGFGFARTAAAVLAVAVAGLGWMWAEGHAIEVVAAVLAAVSVELLDKGVSATRINAANRRDGGS
ncbi:hypothetical protein ACIRIR_35650 [Streptomyces globisporus]|uniref:hypothetical protein n=1 Tax=Streptomyces globisporus TaxID=1908 RepID=UPI0037FEC386